MHVWVGQCFRLLPRANNLYVWKSPNVIYTGYACRDHQCVWYDDNHNGKTNPAGFEQTSHFLVVVAESACFKVEPSNSPTPQDIVLVSVSLNTCWYGICLAVRHAYGSSSLFQEVFRAILNHLISLDISFLPASARTYSSPLRPHERLSLQYLRFHKIHDSLHEQQSHINAVFKLIQITCPIS